MSGFDKNETLLMMALSRVPHLSLRQKKILVDTMGSALPYGITARTSRT